MTKRLVVIDGKSVFYRGYYAMPNLSLPDGTPTGGVYGFVSLAIELIKKLEPDYVAVAWDKKDTNIRKRREIYPDYKAGRKKAPDDFYAQIPILYELLEAFGWPLYELDDYEADDILGAFAREATAKNIETCLLTSDLDALQLIGPMVKVYALKNGLSNIEEFNVDYFEKKYGIRVDQYLDLKSIKGDSSDNLPGVPGIGEKTGVMLLQKYDNLDNIYQHINEIKPAIAKKLLDGKELAYISKKVARIWDDAPIKLDWNVADINDINLEKVAGILKKLEFFSLINRLPKHMQIDSIIDAKEEFPKVVEKPWPDSLIINGPIILDVIDNMVYLSIDSKTVYKKDIKQINSVAWSLMAMSKIIAFDVKKIYHDLDQAGITIKFEEIHDIRQAAFLINPLVRDNSKQAILGLSNECHLIDEIAASWLIYDKQSKFFEVNPKLADIAKRFDFPLVYILFMIEKRGVKINPVILHDLSKQLSDELARLEQEMYQTVGYEFNIASPLQLSEVLFTKLQLPTEGIKKGKTGYSTGQKELDKLRGQHPIIEMIEKTRELAKLKNTYVDVLPNLADSKGRIHTTFNQDVASTGRLSSTNPNLQNIPIRTEHGREVRRAFIPEVGKVFVSADYSQFELRLAAFLAQDTQMIADFNGDFDIHTKTASEVYGIPIESVTKEQRRNAKVINFGVLYGMSPHGLSAATGMTFIDAKKFIDEYFEVREPIRKYINLTLENARRDGYVETFFGRRRPTPDVLSSNYMVRSAAERAAANMPIQGTEADLMKLAMIEVDKQIEGLGEQILQVHDSILIESIPENAEKIANILREVMENIAPEISIKLKVDVKIGNNWGEL